MLFDSIHSIRLIDYELYYFYSSHRLTGARKNDSKETSSFFDVNISSSFREPERHKCIQNDSLRSNLPEPYCTPAESPSEQERHLTKFALATTNLLSSQF
jgi:hypothetical protein